MFVTHYCNKVVTLKTFWFTVYNIEMKVLYKISILSSFIKNALVASCFIANSTNLHWKITVKLYDLLISYVPK